MAKKITLSVMILFLLYSFSSIIMGYFNPFGGSGNLGTHSYYLSMLGDLSNWKILLANLVFSLIPLSYIVFKKEKGFFGFAIWLYFGLALYNLVSIYIKGDFLGGGLIMIFLNTFIIFFVIVYFILGILSLGTFLKSKCLKLKTETIFDIFMNLGIGLSVFLLANYVLIVVSLFYSFISWIFFLSFAYFIYSQKSQLAEIQKIIMKMFGGFASIFQKFNINTFFALLLILFSIAYFYYGFTGAYIPYPTAWDANHAYMFIPKIWAYSHGFDWSGNSLVEIGSLWSAYLGFWFNLFWPMEKSFWITPDTFAIELNFFSGALVLFFALALFKEILDSLPKFNIFVNKKDNEYEGENAKGLIFNIGWFFILLWLTSGMGAFLVFVDNKTDLGIMALIILAVYSGFVALKNMFEKKDQQKKGFADYYDMIISGFLFGIAILSKPTSFLDAFNFGLLMFWIFIGTIGTLGIVLLILGGLSFIKFRGISDYIDSKIGGIIAVPGAIGFLYDFVKSLIGSKKQYLKYMMVWFVTILATLVIFKGIFLFAYQIVIQKGFSPKNYIQSLLFSANKTNKVYADEQTGAVLTGTADSSGSVVEDSNPECSLKSVGATTSADLYKDLKTVEDTSYQEDVGRYIGYGARTFVGPWWGFLFPGSGSCYGFDNSAVLLCQNASLFDDVSKIDLAKARNLMDSMSKDSQGYKLLDSMFQKIDYKTDTQLTEDIQSKISSDIENIKTFYAENSIYTSIAKSSNGLSYAKTVNIPYKYLVFFNITFNWSLQNQSSYYTDIGFVWLILLILNFVGLIYGIVKRNKVLTVMQGISAFAWVIWFFIGGGILWYGMGIVVWAILAFIVFVYYLFSQKDEIEKGLFNTFIIILVLFGVWQLLLNFIRISTQGASGPFSWYKQSFGQEQKISIGESTLTPETSEVFPYTSDRLFGIQFGHYNKFLNIVNNRAEGDGMLLAGTYARYFIKNQTNIIYDQFLTQFYGRINDDNACKTYLRLKDKKIKYITIDPNIGTVVMGGGNSSLFDRFFAKFNSVSGKVESYGAFLMLGEMYSRGYLNYISSNNLAIKYAFSLPNDEIKKFMGSNLGYQDLGIFRAKLSLLRFWSDREMFLNFMMSEIKIRITSLDFVGDLADIQGKNVDEEKIKTALKGYIVNNENIKDLVQDMTDDERYILFNYLSIYQSMKSDEKTFEQSISSILSQNISSGSQIMSLEVK